MNRPSYPLVVIEWVDSTRPVSDWHHIDNLPELEVVKCVSVGWVVSQDDLVVMLAPNMGDHDNDNAQASGMIRIPTRAITAKITLDYVAPI